MDLQIPNGDRLENIRRPLVLAVDDNQDNLQLITQVLILLDCSYITAEDGRTAIIMAQTYQPDLILLDMMLPDVNGVEVAYQLKQDFKTKAVPIIAVTAMARVEDRERLMKAGCNDYIKKPYIIDELEAIIGKYLF